MTSFLTSIGPAPAADVFSWDGEPNPPGRPNGSIVSDPATLPLPDPGLPVRSPQAHARAARRRLRMHQLEWIGLTLLVALTAVARDVPPLLSPTTTGFGIVLAIRAWRGAGAEQAVLLRSRGPAPTNDMVAAVTWRADPRGQVAEGFRRARNWWALWTLGAAAYLALRGWMH